MQMWHSSIDGSPGISSSALDILSEKATKYFEENHHRLHVTLLSDETSLRKEISWCAEKKSFIGLSTVTNSSQHRGDENNQDDSELNVAGNALVLMVVGPDFKIGVAYHLLNGLEGVDRAALTLEVVRKVEETGVIIMGLTSDGLYQNVVVAELLGARFGDKKIYFRSPTYPEQRIYIFFDPPHMIKLVRKYFSEGNLLYKGQPINWLCLCKLVQRQSSENFSLCNKLTQRHIDWHQKPMNVKLAAQTISRSVADALEQLCRDGYEEFQGCEATAEFLRIFNDEFDMLNFAANDQVDNKCKQPICEESATTIFEFCDKFNQYIEHLEIDVTTKANNVYRKPILESQARMGFFGFYYNNISLRGVFDDFVRNGPLEKFFTMQASQDHLETFFSLIKNCQGRCNKVNVTEFRSAFRKLLVCHPLITSADHNVITNATGILTASSAPKKKLPAVTLSGRLPEIEIEVFYEDLLSTEIQEMDPYDEHMCAYLASCIESKIAQKVERLDKRTCFECVGELAQNEKVTDEFLAMKNNAKQPCTSTVNIVIFANAIMKLISSHVNAGDFNIVAKTIASNLNVNELYTASISDFESHQQQSSSIWSHKEEFVTLVVKTYLTLKSQKIGKRITEEERQKFIEKKKKKKKNDLDLGVV